jgi:hypothetical protein
VDSVVLLALTVSVRPQAAQVDQAQRLTLPSRALVVVAVDQPPWPVLLVALVARAVLAVEAVAAVALA